MSSISRKILSVLLVIIIASTCFVALAACTGEEVPPLPTALSAPTVTLTADTASWQADANADKFEVSIGGALSYLENSVTSKKLNDGDSFKVRSVGDGLQFTTSEWSNTVTYTATSNPAPTALAVPVVTVDANGLASWVAVSNASGYKYKIDNGTEQTASGLSVQLTDGQAIVVKAVGNGTTRTDSAYSATATYTATATPNALSVPHVFINASGLASWVAVSNASGYKYKIDNGTEQTASGLSVILTDGQSIVVKAVGNGTTYTDSAYSTSLTYTAPIEGVAPSYLGIVATSIAPVATGEVPVSLSAMSPSLGSTPRSLTDALTEYYENEQNYLSDHMPAGSDYTLYSAVGETVYVQIWLNNPSQYTILSLKLNGTKYQVGGGLSSFFKQEGTKYYNCIYVAVEIPADTFVDIAYEVSEIEYIANTFINADGTDTFMNDNDTVTIGLPYGNALPVVSDLIIAADTVSTCTATFTLSDADDLTATGGWLRAVIYDGYDVIAHQKVAVGANTFNASGLVEATDYSFVVYLYADLHDGNGVTVHLLADRRIHTPEVITINEISGGIGYDDDNNYGAKITVDTTLNNTTAEYIKLEILDDNDTVVYTDTAFDGSASVVEGLLNATAYKVRVYYRDTEYPDGKYVEESAYVSSFSYLDLYDLDYYSLLNDVVIEFSLGNNDNRAPIVDSFVLNIFDRESAQFIAEYVLQYLDTPALVDDINTRYSQALSAFEADPGNVELYRAKEALLEQKSFWDNYILHVYDNKYNSNSDRAFWEAEQAKGKYYYSFAYDGTNTDTFFEANGVYYAVCEDYYTRNAANLEYVLTAQVDKNEGDGIEEIVFDDALRTDNYMFGWGDVVLENQSGEDGSLSFDLYNRNVDAAYKYAKLGWVTKITVSREAEAVVVYENATMPTLDFDEAAWLAEYLAAVKAGTDTSALFMSYVGTYGDTFTTTYSKTGFAAGEHTVAVYTKLYADRATDDPELSTFTTIIHEKLATPVISFESNEAMLDDGLDGYDNHSYLYDIVDKDDAPVATNQDISGGKIAMSAVGNKIRAKAVGTNEYYLDSDWSAWYTFGGTPLNAPTLSYSAEDCAVVIAAVSNAGSYAYTINGGVQSIISSSETLEIPVGNGDVVRVKAIPSAASLANAPYTDSAWASFTCTDNRTTLSTPTNLRVSADGTHLLWDTVEHATDYYIEISTSKGTSTDTTRETQYPINNGETYRVRATGDTVAYKPGQWSAAFTYQATLAQPVFESVDSGYVRWSSVSNASDYNWKINDGAYTTVGKASSARRVALSEMLYGDKLYVQAIDDSGEYADSDWAMIYHYIEQLATPVVTIDNGVASWVAIANANGYKYTINGGTETATSDLSVSGLLLGDTISVCATSTSANYSQSEWCAPVTARTKLSAPTVTIDESGLASWPAVANAESYVYKIGENGEIGTTETPNSSMSVQLSVGQTIVVKCVGGGLFGDSDYSTMQEYEDNRPRLATPTLAYDNVNGLVATVIADGMVNVVYKCGMIGETQESLTFGDGTAQEINLGSGFSFLDDDHRVYVKIVPEGDDTYRESEWASIEITD